MKKKKGQKNRNAFPERTGRLALAVALAVAPARPGGGLGLQAPGCCRTGSCCAVPSRCSSAGGASAGSMSTWTLGMPAELGQL